MFHIISINGEKEKMKIRTDRLFAAVLSLIITLSITLVTIVAVMAANSQTLSGSMSVSYHANNVAATLRATYQVAGSNNAVSLVNTTNNTDYLRFYATDATTTGELNGGNIYLTSSSPYVLFTFAFTNNATRDLENNVQGYDIRITLSDNSVRNNVTARYMTDTTAPSGTLSSKYETMSEASTELPSAVYVGAEQTVYFYLLLEMTDLDYSAQYASYSNAGVSWTLDHVDYKDGADPDFTINTDGVLTAYNGSGGDVVIPSLVTSIYINVFKNNTTIESISIPSSVINVGASAFYGCSNLEAVIFESESSLTSSNTKNIVNNKQSSLGEVFTTTIGSSAFAHCPKLATLILPNNLVTIPYCMCFINLDLPNTCLTSITIPNSVTYISDSAFTYCTGLTSIVIPNSVTFIGGGAFRNCYGLISATIGSSVETIGNYAFYGCSSLTSVAIPNSVYSIGPWAFCSCRSFTSITIPNSVTFIGDYAFSGCSILASVTFSTTSGWWYASSETATSGTSLSSADLSNTTTAATYLKATYRNYYWRRS